MTTIDLTPLYRSSIGFDRLASMLDSTYGGEQSYSSYPPYNIEVKDENQYAITLAVAGFNLEDLDIQVEKSLLTVRGNHPRVNVRQEYLYQGIADRPFERKFTLADYVEVTDAQLDNGLLSIHLVKRIPDEMKPKSIQISTSDKQTLEHANKQVKAKEKAA